MNLSLTHLSLKRGLSKFSCGTSSESVKSIVRLRLRRNTTSATTTVFSVPDVAMSQDEAPRRGGGFTGSQERKRQRKRKAKSAVANAESWMYASVNERD